MSVSISYFPEVQEKSTLGDLPQAVKSMAKRTVQKTSPQGYPTIRYFPEAEGESLGDGETMAEEGVAADSVTEDGAKAIAPLQQRVQDQLALQTAYLEAIAPLEDLDIDPDQLQTLLRELVAMTVNTTVTAIQADPKIIQLEDPQSPRLPGYFKHLPKHFPLLDHGGADKQQQETLGYERERYLKLREIGRVLKLTRQKQAISRHQLHQHTHILTSHIDALEEGDFERLPEDLYIKGFIKRLGDALKLNGDALAASFQTRQPPTNYFQRTLDEEKPWIEGAYRYLGYGALITGAVSGLSWSLGHQAQQNVMPLEPHQPSPTTTEQTEEEISPQIVQKQTKIAPPETMQIP